MDSPDSPSSAASVEPPFLRLPLEIRRKIYSYFLVLDKGKEIVNPWLLGNFPSGCHPRRIEGLDSRILASCRSLHSETSDMLYGDNVFRITSPLHFEECFQLIQQHFVLVKHLSIEIGTEIGEEWKDFLIRNGEEMLRQLTRLRSVKINLLGDTARLSGRDCYGEIDDEYIKIFKLIADAGLDTTIYGVCFVENPGLQQKLPHVRLMPADQTIDRSVCMGRWRDFSL